MPKPKVRHWLAGVAVGACGWVFEAGSLPAVEPALPAVPAAAPARLAPEELARIEQMVRLIHKGTCDAQSRTAAQRELPWSRLSMDGRRQVEAVLGTLTLYRELPTLAVQTEPEVQRYFIEHPDMAVALWRAMGISKLRLTAQEAGQFTCDDTAGTVGTATILYQGPAEALVACEGTVKSPFLAGSIEARALLHLTTDHVTGEDGQTWCRNRVRIFVSIPSQTVAAAAQLLSPLTNMIFDRNLQEVCVFISIMNKGMIRQPGWIEHLARRVEGVPRQRQTELVELTARTFVHARKQELAKTPGVPITVEEILRPLRAAEAAQ